MNEYSTNQSNYLTVCNKKIPLFDELNNNAGLTKIHYLTMAFSFFILFIDGMHMCLINVIFIPFQNLYNLSEFQVSLISSSMFLAVGAGSMLSGNKNLIGSRKEAIVRYTFVIFLFHFLIGVFTNLALFIIFRICIGVSLGIIMPKINNLLVEILPVKNRSFIMISIGVSFNLGAICLNVLLFIIMPNFEKDRLYLVFLISSIPIALFTYIMYKYIRESPRYMILNNQEEEGLTMLEELTNSKIDEEKKQIIIKEINQGANKQVETNLRAIFEDKFLKITIIIISLWSANSLLAYGGTIALSLTMKYMESHSVVSNNTSTKLITNTDIIKQQILIYSIALPGAILAGAMTEVKTFGRKYTALFGFSFIIVFLLIALSDLNHFAIFIGLVAFFLGFTFSSVNSYSCEVYPTKIRDTAIGFFYFCNRIVAFFSQFIAVIAFNIHYLAPEYLCVIVAGGACFMCWMIPYDTHGRVLDVDEEEIPNSSNLSANNKHIQLNNEMI